MVTLAEIYDWFMTGKKPTQAQFWASWGSFWHKLEQIPQSAIAGLIQVLNAKAEKAQFDAHKTDENAHAALFAAKADAQALLNHIQATFESIGLEAQNRANRDDNLQFQIDDTNDFVSQARSDIAAINILLTSNDVNLDTVQEIVDAIKTVETSLSTILVNYLTTGGATKALTAEMGKTLKGLIDGITIPKATDIVSGTVKTDVPTADPVVYVKETVDTLLEGKANYFLDIKTITGISYNVIIGDILHELVYNGTLPMNVIIPNNTAVAFPIGTIFYTLGTSTGIVTASGASGVILNVKAGISLSALQNEVRQYTKIATNTWSVRGDLNLGAVTQTELSYLQGLRSNAQAQIDAKVTLNGTPNYLMKFLTAATATVSRIWDTGTFLGIGTVNTPTKDLTFGNQANREIGIEESNNAVVGRDLITRAGRTVNYSNGLFSAYHAQTGSLILENNTNDIYLSAARYTYKRTNAVGDFNTEPVPGGNNEVQDMKLGFDNNIFVIKSNIVYVQYSSTGAYNIYPTTGLVGTPNSIAIDLTDRHIFISTTQGKVFKQTAGTGSFVDLAVTSRSYSGLVITLSHKLFARVYGEGAYKFTATDFYKIPAISDSIIYGGFLSVSKVNNNLFISPGYETQDVKVFDTDLETINIFAANIYYGGTVATRNDGSTLLTSGTGILIKNSATGTPNLDGGTKSEIAGTGKGTGKSRWNVFTGQKLPSGTDMQTETKRLEIDEDGNVMLFTDKIFANNAAALAAGLPIKTIYWTSTGEMRITI